MFGSLIEKVRGLFGGQKKTKPVANKTGKKGKKKSPGEAKQKPFSRKPSVDDGKEKQNRKRGRRAKAPSRPAKSEVHGTADFIEKANVERPAALSPVDPQEGKVRFLDLPFAENIQFSVQHAGFSYCTPIQALALPGLLEGRDLAAKAQTGTGKTAAFLLTMFNRFVTAPCPERKPGCPRFLALAPTRELAAQIYKDAISLSAFVDIDCQVVYGGTDYEKQRRRLMSGVDLLVGTPGRVIDCIRRGDLDLSKIEFLVVDEADRMLDMGFIPDVKRIVSELPRRGVRQTSLFSATLDESILRLSQGWLADPVVVESEPEQMVSDNIFQKFYSVLRDDKLALLLYLLRTEPYERVMIFGNRKDVNLRLQFDLRRYGYSVPVLSGDVSQNVRERTLENFRSGKERIVICTDVAARGIHVDDVSIVINFDLPERAEDYIHRIGRTGRAGHKGKAISFLCEYGAYYLPDIEKLMDVTFPSELPSEEMLKLPPVVEDVSPDNPFSGSSHRTHRGGRGGGSGARRKNRR
ncbi:MAG: DEAD/DEAH box helicase [Victivallaceae bacterium]|nr:DEAD/DEAH box helicase [Victivallaceae bacterium]